MNKLLEMLTYRRPAGSEAELEFRMKFIMSDPRATVDAHENLIIEVGQGSRTIFSSHTDTVHRQDGIQPIVYDASLGIVYKDDKDPLGADDGAGVWILLKMIEAGVPGVYMFHYGEERGGIGSSAKAQEEPEWFSRFDRAIAFDRRATGDVITHQAGGRCCSDEFAGTLADRLNAEGMDYKPCSGGIFTDTANYTRLVSECTNLSVGYENEHTASEHLDLLHLEALLSACLKIDWESLPKKRDHTALDMDDWRYFRRSKYGAYGGSLSGGLGLDGIDAVDERDAWEVYRIEGLVEVYNDDPYQVAEYALELEGEVDALGAEVEALRDKVRELKQLLKAEKTKPEIDYVIRPKLRSVGEVIPF